MRSLRTLAKKLVSAALTGLVWLYSLGTRKKNPHTVHEVGVLFLPILGIGDLLMLSPVIQALADYYSGARVTLITWVPEIINFKNIRVIHREQARQEKFDLIISPSLNLKHLPFIFKSKFWIGYFASSRVQANFPIRPARYNQTSGHYIERGLALLKAFNANTDIQYPELLVSEPPYFKKQLAGVKYAVFNIYAQFAERSWPLKNFMAVAKHLLETKRVEKIVLVGGASASEQTTASEFMRLAHEFGSAVVVNVIGKNNLKETAFLMKQSMLFVGLDTGPAHLAYLVAARSVVVFITVPPENRLPKIEESSRRIAAVYPNPAPPRPLYSGWGAGSPEAAARYATTITPARVAAAIDSLF